MCLDINDKMTSLCCSAVSRKTECKMFYCFYFIVYIRLFILLIEANVNISNEHKFSDILECKLHWVTSKVYMTHFEVHLLCMQPNVVYSLINLRKMKFIWAPVKE